MKKIKLMLLTLMSILVLFVSGCKNLAVKEEVVKIGVSWDKNYTDGEIPEDTVAYLNSVKKSGAMPILLPQIKNREEAISALKTVDAVLLIGGEDIDPKYYGEKPHKNLEEINSDRDVSDYWLIKTAIEKDYPYLGTCRGMQFLNVVRGGSLYQDLATEYKSNIVHRDPKVIDFTYHNIQITDKSSKLYEMLKIENIKVNSWHHQAVKKLGNGLKVTSVSSDGIVEGVELEGKTFIVAVQFHPEWHLEDDENEFLPMFEMLKKEGLKNRKRNK